MSGKVEDDEEESVRVRIEDVEDFDFRLRRTEKKGDKVTGRSVAARPFQS